MCGLINSSKQPLPWHPYTFFKLKISIWWSRLYHFDFPGTSAPKPPTENSILKKAVDTSQAIAVMECSKVLSYGSISWVIDTKCTEVMISLFKVTKNLNPKNIPVGKHLKKLRR